MTQSVQRWWVYLLECADHTLYTGVTTDLARRVDQHNGMVAGGARYTRARRPVRLIWSEMCDCRSSAQRREVAVRKLDRRQKLALAQRADDQGGL